MTGARNAHGVLSRIYGDPATGLIIIQNVAPSCGYCVKLLSALNILNGVETDEPLGWWVKT